MHKLQESGHRIRVLQFVPEHLPTYRPDVAALFGMYLPASNVGNDLVGYTLGGDVVDWPAGQVFLASGGKIKSSWKMLCLHFKLLLGVQRHQYDVVQSRDMVWSGLLALALCKLTNKPFCYWVSFLMSESRMLRAQDRNESIGALKRIVLFVKGWIESQILYRIILPNADHVFTQSSAMNEYVASKGISAAKLTAVPMGVDLQKIDSQMITPCVHPKFINCPVVAYLGSLDRLRSLDRLISAVALAKEAQPNLKLLLVGDASHAADRRFLEEYAARHNISDSVHITGWLPSAEAWSLILGSDIAVSYVPRGFLFDVSSPTKVVEYLAMEMPTIANDSPDQSIMLANSEFGLITDGSAESFKNAIAEMLGNMAEAKSKAILGRQFVAETRDYAVLAELVADQYISLVKAAQ